MRYLVLSDVHGNRFGLEAVLQSARGEFDSVLCLGDVVGYGAHPNECCEILNSRNALCLMGNHDAAALGLISIEWFNPVAQAALNWTREQLTAQNREWLNWLSPQMEAVEDDFQAVHASLREPLEEYIIGPSVAQPTLRRMRHPLCFFGHTHVAVIYSCRDVPGQKYRLDADALPEGGELEAEADWRYLVNPGSCGQPRDGNPQARYALFDSKTRHIEVVAIDYDWQAARDAILKAGLPKVLGDRLGLGR